MEKETILRKLEAAVTAADKIGKKRREEILGLIAQLRDGESGPAEKQKSESGVEELRDSILEFEAAHPDLVEMTNRACKLLSDIGI